MTRKHWLTTLTLAVLAALVAAPGAWAVKLDEANIFIEINDTDGDAGIQLFLDGVGWKKIKMKDPNGAMVLLVRAEGSIAMQGITELFFESAEPSFEEQSLDELLALFPEGVYRIRGITSKGRRINGRARLTHDIPDAPVLLSPEDGEEVDPDDTVIEWERVPNPPGSKIVGYQVIVEREEPTLLVFSVDVDSSVTKVTVPSEFMLPETEYKFEVLAIERSGNQTIAEREFETE